MEDWRCAPCWDCGHYVALHALVVRPDGCVDAVQFDAAVAVSPTWLYGIQGTHATVVWACICMSPTLSAQCSTAQHRQHSQPTHAHAQLATGAVRRLRHAVFGLPASLSMAQQRGRCRSAGATVAERVPTPLPWPGLAACAGVERHAPPAAAAAATARHPAPPARTSCWASCCCTCCPDGACSSASACCKQARHTQLRCAHPAPAMAAPGLACPMAMAPPPQACTALPPPPPPAPADMRHCCCRHCYCSASRPRTSCACASACCV